MSSDKTATSATMRADLRAMSNADLVALLKEVGTGTAIAAMALIEARDRLERLEGARLDRAVRLAVQSVGVALPASAVFDIAAAVVEAVRQTMRG